MALQKRPKSASKEQVIAYIEDVLFKGATKKDAYKAHINPDIKEVYPAIKSLEEREDFKALYNVLNQDGNLAAQHTALRVKSKYVQLIEKNIDKATEILAEAETIKDKSTAVRLVNETVGALSVIATPQQAGGGEPGKLNRSGVVIEQ